MKLAERGALQPVATCQKFIRVVSRFRRSEKQHFQISERSIFFTIHFFSHYPSTIMH